MISNDYGVVFELDDTDITTSYQTPSSTTSDTYASRVQRRRYSILASLLSVGTNITAIVAKLQASKDGSSWYDVVSTDDADGDPFLTEHTYDTIVDDTISGSFYTDGGFNYLRVAVKAVGGAGQATETLQVSALDIALGTTISAAQLPDAVIVEDKIADAAVTEPKLADGAVTTDKLADDSVTAAKLDDGALVYDGFTGHNNTGACTLTGAKVGDLVLGVVNLTDGGGAASSFESTITVADQIQQTSASNLSAKKFSLLLLKRGS